MRNLLVAALDIGGLKGQPMREAAMHLPDANERLKNFDSRKELPAQLLQRPNPSLHWTCQTPAVGARESFDQLLEWSLAVCDVYEIKSLMKKPWAENIEAEISAKVRTLVYQWTPSNMSLNENSAKHLHFRTTPKTFAESLADSLHYISRNGHWEIVLHTWGDIKQEHEQPDVVDLHRLLLHECKVQQRKVRAELESRARGSKKEMDNSGPTIP